MSPDEWKKNPVLLDVARELAFRPVGWGVNVSLQSVDDTHPKNGPDNPLHRDYLNLALALGGHRLVDAQPTLMNLVEQMAEDQNLGVRKYDFFYARGVVGLRNRSGAETGSKYEVRPGHEGTDGVRFAHDLSRILAKKIAYIEEEIFARFARTTFFEHGKKGFTFCGNPVRFCAPGGGLYWLVPKPEAVDLPGVF
jgi:hypothetical protein